MISCYLRLPAAQHETCIIIILYLHLLYDVDRRTARALARCLAVHRRLFSCRIKLICFFPRFSGRTTVNRTNCTNPLDHPCRQCHVIRIRPRLSSKLPLVRCPIKGTTCLPQHPIPQAIGTTDSRGYRSCTAPIMGTGLGSRCTAAEVRYTTWTRCRTRDSSRSRRYVSRTTRRYSLLG